MWDVFCNRMLSISAGLHPRWGLRRHTRRDTVRHPISGRLFYVVEVAGNTFVRFVLSYEGGPNPNQLMLEAPCPNSLVPPVSPSPMGGHLTTRRYDVGICLKGFPAEVDECAAFPARSVPNSCAFQWGVSVRYAPGDFRLRVSLRDLAAG